MHNLLWKVTIFAIWPFLWVCGLIAWTLFCFVTWPLIFLAEIILDDVVQEIDDWKRN